MKIFFSLALLFALIVSCGREEEIKFEAFNPEAFAYDLGDSWETNATVNVRGFNKIEIEDEFSASLDFSVDLVIPEGDTLENIFRDSKVEKEREINYIQLEAQFELDTTYSEGKYKIIFHIRDNNSENSTSAEVEVLLKE